MSKSAREDRPWKYGGTFTLLAPIKKEDIQKHIVEGCICYACEANRRRLEGMEEIKEIQE